MISCVSGVVRVIPQAICRACRRARSSGKRMRDPHPLPASPSKPSLSCACPAARACRFSSGQAQIRSAPAWRSSPRQGLSPIRPAGMRFSPIWISHAGMCRWSELPRRIPVPVHPPAQLRNARLIQEQIVDFPFDDRQALLLSQHVLELPRGIAPGLPECAARAPQGPFCGSAGGTGYPPVGRTAHQTVQRVNFPDQMTLSSPPIAGLHDMTPIVSARWVTSAVLAPVRADAAAASHPAWPPPTTITSKLSQRLH